MVLGSAASAIIYYVHAGSTMPLLNFNLLLRVATVVLPLSLIVFLYERALVPLYGTGPTTLLLNKVILCAILVSALQPCRISTSNTWLFTAVALTLAPNATYWTAVWTSRFLKDPVLGPAMTHALVLGPLVFVLATFSIHNDRIPPAPITLRLIKCASIYVSVIGLAQRLWPRLSALNIISESQIFLAFAGTSYAVWIMKLPLALNKDTVKSRRHIPRHKASSALQVKYILLIVFGAVWWSISPLLANPVLPHPLPQPFTHPTYPLQILSAVQSVTGLITVAEWLPLPSQIGNDQEMHSVRYLRASHSLLGGVWTRSKVQTLDGVLPVSDSSGTPLGDSIYSTFVLQEAVRLVNSTEVGKSGKWSNVLIIGLGAGISATSFIRHDISATIVEIDPAVYVAARTYFGLPDPGPGNVFLEDARSWVNRRRADISTGVDVPLFDIVVHDCFSGGGVPEHLFTTVFWEDLKATMQTEGIVVVNFAGIIHSESSKLITNTLERSFPQCRAFHDMSEDLPEEKYDTEFVNLVLFCTLSSSPLTFRQPKSSDYLGSYLRKYVFESLAEREVNLASIREPNEKYILTDKNNSLGKLQEQQGAHHWEGMSCIFSFLCTSKRH